MKTTNTEIRGELIALGSEPVGVIPIPRALVHCTITAIRNLAPNLTQLGPESVAILASTELDALRADTDRMNLLESIKETTPMPEAFAVWPRRTTLRSALDAMLAAAKAKENQ